VSGCNCAQNRVNLRAHFSTAETETKRHAAAERLGELIERREQLLSEVSQVERLSPGD
jgi:hypothetical protein